MLKNSFKEKIHDTTSEDELVPFFNGIVKYLDYYNFLKFHRESTGKISNGTVTESSESQIGQ